MHSAEQRLPVLAQCRAKACHVLHSVEQRPVRFCTVQSKGLSGLTQCRANACHVLHSAEQMPVMSCTVQSKGLSGLAQCRAKACLVLHSAEQRPVRSCTVQSRGLSGLAQCRVKAWQVLHSAEQKPVKSCTVQYKVLSSVRPFAVQNKGQLDFAQCSTRNSRPFIVQNKRLSGLAQYSTKDCPVFHSTEHTHCWTKDFLAFLSAKDCLVYDSGQKDGANKWCKVQSAKTKDRCCSFRPFWWAIHILLGMFSINVGTFSLIFYVVSVAKSDEDLSVMIFFPSQLIELDLNPHRDPDSWASVADPGSHHFWRLSCLARYKNKIWSCLPHCPTKDCLVCHCTTKKDCPVWHKTM